MTKILIMEDETTFAELVQTELENAGHDVTLTSTGSQAVELLKREKFDILIADIFVKIRGRVISDGGILLIGRVRAAMPGSEMAHNQKMPIIAITGGQSHPGQENLLRNARSMGADEVLQKPFTHQELVEKMDFVLAARQR